MKTTNEIRDLFLNYFGKLDHTVVKSSSLVPYNDPSLMFTNSGMVQFKDIFLGKETRPYNKATSSQKCVRAGGKHNDLDNVGYTKRHLTFFEMLGNFSFGDYFKQDAIEYAWNFLTKELGLDESRLYVTVYHTDLEAFNFWKKLTRFDDSKIIKISTTDNFWSMGDVGPCGPCSEIFYDQGEQLSGGLPGSPEQDGDRYVEIWNLVFMQNEQTKLGMIDLPKQSIDTGMGLERISGVVQGVYDNFAIDVFKSIIDNIAAITDTKSLGDNKVSHRVIADHLRSSAFLVAEGVSPSNEGRGYVLRRIMRRAIRHVYALGYKDLLLPKLVPVLSAEMGHHFPELIKQQELISSIFEQEESSFRNTISKGMKLIEVKMGELKAGAVFPGKEAFELHDTYGFPLDLTADLLKVKGFEVDNEGFDKYMAMQKEQARNAWAGSGEKAINSIWFDVKERIGLTEFLGYVDHRSQGEVLSLVQCEKETKSIENHDEFYLVTNQTPFYGESGGQMGDVGRIFVGTNVAIKVLDTKKPLPGLHIHVCKLEKGTVKVGDIVNLEINVEYRNALRRNHTATHLLHAVLRSILGKHLAQRGSLVAHDRLRFDFSHGTAIEKDKLNQVELLVNKMILTDAEVKTKLMRYEDAVSTGAMALFGEKYDDEVRVVVVEHDSESYSVELCGGTHVSRLGEIGGIRLLSESAIASGIRRIEAVTGLSAYQEWRHDYNLLSDLCALVQSKPDMLVEKISDLLRRNKDLEKSMQAQKHTHLASGISEDEVVMINKIAFLTKTLLDSSVSDLRSILQQYISNKPNFVVLFFGTEGDKTSFVCGVSKDLHSKIGAKTLLKIVTDVFGSNGGGNDFIAQGGGDTDASKIERSILEVTNLLKSI